MKLKTVGIKDIRLPVRIRQRSGGLQDTVATVTLMAKLPSRYRQGCVNEFLAILHSHQHDLSAAAFPGLLQEVRDRLRAEAARVEMTFPYFLAKQAPVTGTVSLMEYACRFTGGTGDRDAFILSVWVPITTLCPCSKEISEHGAHNQRAEINLNVAFHRFIWLEDLIALVESAASCEVFALLKRPDEKFVTEAAYNNPMFVEDVARKIAELARNHPDIGWFSVGVESFESIHKHSAYAFIDSDEM
ncbi:MAG: GTP cyclohydrolase FolE2 [Thermodesulfobacteriota bacterium]